jgi:hypothetical protein
MLALADECRSGQDYGEHLNWVSFDVGIAVGHQLPADDLGAGAADPATLDHGRPPPD